MFDFFDKHQPLDEFRINELEKMVEDGMDKLTEHPQIAKIVNEAENDPMTKLKMVACYALLNNEEMFKKLMEAEPDFFQNEKLIDNKININKFIILGALKTNLIYNENMRNRLSEIYEKARQYYIDLGEEEFTQFMSLCAVGYIVWRNYYETNMQKIVEEQAAYFINKDE